MSAEPILHVPPGQRRPRCRARRSGGAGDAGRAIARLAAGAALVRRAGQATDRRGVRRLVAAAGRRGAGDDRRHRHGRRDHAPPAPAGVTTRMARSVDGLERPALRAYLLERLLAGETLHGHELRCVGVPLVTDEAIDSATSRVVGVEQSNTSVIYGDRAIMKVYRRLVAGPNPEVELGRYLTGAGFPAVPRLLATAQLVGPDGFVADLLVLQDFVPNDGDGWAWAVAAAEAGPGGVRFARCADGLAGAGAGRRSTARRRSARRPPNSTPRSRRRRASELRPLPVTAEDRAAWAATLRREAEETLVALDRAGHADPALRAAVTAAGEIPLADLTDGGLRTRVHGDYHLGQVLRSRGRLDYPRLRGRTGALARRAPPAAKPARGCGGHGPLVGLRRADRSSRERRRRAVDALADALGHDDTRTVSSTPTGPQPNGQRSPSCHRPRQTAPRCSARSRRRRRSTRCATRLNNRPDLAAHPGGRGDAIDD